MESKSDPTFAEALLSLVIAERTWYHGCPISTAWNDACERACTFARGAPPEIRRALGADKQMSEPYDGLPIGHLISLIASAKRGDPIQQADVDALEEWRSTRSPVVDKQPVIEPRELALEKQLADAQQDARDATTMIAQAHREKAAAVARAEKAEAQAAEARAAKADVMAANLRARTAQDERDSLAAKLREAQDAAQSYWLIELSPSCYLTAAGCLIPKFTWTAEYDSALKFQSKTEADQVLTAIRNLVPSLFPENLPTCARPTEHAWIAARKALDAKEQP